ncbi:MAG: hypothetical protein ACRD3W_19125 [Terriglobales bacterium]
MHEELTSFLQHQIRRSTDSGDTERAMMQLRQFLEMERQAKCDGAESSGERMSNVRKFPRMRSIN